MLRVATSHVLTLATAARPPHRLAGDDRGEGVISAAIAVLIMAFLGARHVGGVQGRSSTTPADDTRTTSSRSVVRPRRPPTASAAPASWRRSPVSRCSWRSCSSRCSSLLNLYATSVVTAAAYDAARVVAGGDVDHAEPGAVAGPGPWPSATCGRLRPLRRARRRSTGVRDADRSRSGSWPTTRRVRSAPGSGRRPSTRSTAPSGSGSSGPVSPSTAGRRRRGQVRRLEVLPFGILVFVVGIAPDRQRLGGRRREAGRRPPPPGRRRGPTSSRPGSTGTALADAEASGAEAIAGHGRDPDRRGARPGRGPFARCAPVTFVVAYPVPAMPCPSSAASASGSRVAARHAEMIDPLPARPRPASACGSRPAAASGQRAHADARRGARRDRPRRHRRRLLGAFLAAARAGQRGRQAAANDAAAYGLDQAAFYDGNEVVFDLALARAVAAAALRARRIGARRGADRRRPGGGQLEDEATLVFAAAVPGADPTRPITATALARLVLR